MSIQIQPEPTLTVVEGSIEPQRWDEFLGSQPDGTFYQLAGWEPVNTGILRLRQFRLAAMQDAQIRGVLPLVLLESRLFGRILCSMPFVNYGGICASDPRADSALLEAAVKLARELRVDFLELRSARPLDCGLTVSTRKVSMTLELAADPDTLWNSFSSKHRNNIRRAAKNGLVVESGTEALLDEFYAVMRESWRNLGTPIYSRHYFESILQAFPSSTRIHVCRHEGMAIAATLNGHFNGVVEGMWAGGLPAARGLQANYVLYWEMMRDACLLGLRKFHLGRSTADSGGEDFKRKWNAEARQLHWYYFRPDGGAMPDLNVDNPKYRLAIAAWRKLPLWATSLLGPPLARSIP